MVQRGGNLTEGFMACRQPAAAAADYAHHYGSQVFAGVVPG